MASDLFSLISCFPTLEGELCSLLPFLLQWAEGRKLFQLLCWGTVFLPLLSDSGFLTRVFEARIIKLFCLNTSLRVAPYVAVILLKQISRNHFFHVSVLSIHQKMNRRRARAKSQITILNTQLFYCGFLQKNSTVIKNPCSNRHSTYFHRGK